MSSAAEFNFWIDPEPAARVLDGDIDVTIVDLDITHDAALAPAHVERLRAGGRVGSLAASLLGTTTPAPIARSTAPRRSLSTTLSPWRR
jgi:inosine-uridine nucleoside N-ribohydrolase